MKNKITYLSKSKIITKDDEKLIYKIKKEDKQELFNYLKSKDFFNYLPYIERNENYEIYRYIDNNKLPKEDQAIELMNIIGNLHTKTTTYQDVIVENIKKIYEETKEKINNFRNYYLDLQDYIETKIFMSPAEQLLMNNISKFYKALNYAEYKIDNWYKIKEKNKTERVVQLHNNLKLKYFLKEDFAYLINWYNAKKDIVIYDFLHFYKNEYLNLEMTSLFDIYQSNYPYTEEEQILFESLISIPPKITFLKNNYANTIEAHNIVLYVEKTNEFLSKYYKENQESNKQELE